MAANLQIISGVIRLTGGGGPGANRRNARVDFRTGQVTGDATAVGPIRGVSGRNFRDAPHVIVSPSDLSLSTKDNTFYSINRSVTPNQLNIDWRIDSAGRTLELDFLVLGEPA
jgi:hypothetical protein